MYGLRQNAAYTAMEDPSKTVHASRTRIDTVGPEQIHTQSY